MPSPFTFTLPPELSAKEPPERRGIRRDHVRLLVIDRATGRIVHSRFDKIDNYLRAGDLGPCMEVRLAERLPDDSWLALLLCEQGDPFGCNLREGMQIDFAEGLNARVIARDENISRLWKLRFSISGTQLVDLIYRLGKPIRYEYVSAPWDLDYYQTVYATEPGSAEMPSAGRAFTWKLLLNLKRRSIDTAYIVLHAGLSSYMDDELDAQHPSSEEEYLVSATTAEKINLTRAKDGRVIAVGTTVVRALESVVDETGCVTGVHGYTRLKIDNHHRLKVVDGLLTGLHEPEASHLDLLSAFLPAEQIRAAYEEAIQRKYLWHEFGDLNLIL
ncbi:MAG: S-adenosylmethionine:tRNA ribosyltransferase-isomerase [Verrucomicrobia bacterium]|nr:MAG: S-adenosylmethionine:tRNA ribosyltransferase-isomerase [Verrucomicrobiota bacterium]